MPKKKRPNILIMVWRDLIDNPNSGGSEVYVDKIAKGLSKNAKVTVFSSKDSGQKEYQTVDGIDYVRRGSRYTVYFWAFLFYVFKLRKRTDFIIDVENGVPFFTPLYSNKPKLMLLHHFHNGQWFEEFPFPVSILGYTIERYVMPKVYKNTNAVTVSPSSKLDLEVIGFNPKDIYLAYNGVSTVRSRSNSNLLYKNPTALCLGRIKKYKRIELAIKALAEIKKDVPNARLIIAGTGDNERHLKDLTHQLDVTENVKFLGYVSEKKKKELLKKSWVFLNTSSKEGWGVVNVEANLFGTPVLGFNVYGVRDSVKPGVSGELANDYKHFVKLLKTFLSDKELVEKYSASSVKWAHNFKWDKTVSVFNKLIKKNV